MQDEIMVLNEGIKNRNSDLSHMNFMGVRGGGQEKMNRTFDEIQNAAGGGVGTTFENFNSSFNKNDPALN